MGIADWRVGLTIVVIAVAFLTVGTLGDGATLGGGTAFGGGIIHGV